MGFQIVIAGESQCEKFAQVCLIADYLAQNLPIFCYKRIEKPVLEWKPWLHKMNQKNNWHHVGTLLVWKELLRDGSKSYYIGGASEFLDYCYSYYNFDTFVATQRFLDLTSNFTQLHRKNKRELIKCSDAEPIIVNLMRKQFTVCISGAAHALALHIISGLLEMFNKNKIVAKIFLYDKQDSMTYLEYLELQCNYIENNNPLKIVKCVAKIGMALTNSDLLIVLDHVPFSLDSSIGNWLYKNRKVMENLALMINASAPCKMCVILPNLGPACFNATILGKTVTNIKKSNIIVATSDLGLNISSIAAKIAEVPMRNMFCPPVWGFVGINHLVDIRTTIHKYNSFIPLNRFAEVRNTTLCIGTITPEMRTMEYLMYFDESLWAKVAEKSGNKRDITKAIATLNVIRLWFIERNPNQITSLGLYCDGSFGLSFDGIFSQPASLVNGEWIPEKKFIMPRDPQINILYLEKIAKHIMSMRKHELPPNYSAE